MVLSYGDLQFGFSGRMLIYIRAQLLVRHAARNLFGSVEFNVITIM